MASGLLLAGSPFANGIGSHVVGLCVFSATGRPANNQRLALQAATAVHRKNLPANIGGVGD